MVSASYQKAIRTAPSLSEVSSNFVLKSKINQTHSKWDKHRKGQFSMHIAFLSTKAQNWIQEAQIMHARTFPWTDQNTKSSLFFFFLYAVKSALASYGMSFSVVMNIYIYICLCFSSINSSTPAYLSDVLCLLHLCSPSQPLHSSADTCLLKFTLYKYKMKGDCAFSHFGPSVWNSLPPYIRNAATVTTFKSSLKMHLVSLYPSD